jgi:hypothetical protein
LVGRLMAHHQRNIFLASVKEPINQSIEFLNPSIKSSRKMFFRYAQMSKNIPHSLFVFSGTIIFQSNNNRHTQYA